MTENDNTYGAWSYVDQQFSDAVETLATSFDSNLNRMCSALSQLIILSEEQFPDQDIYMRYNSLKIRATEHGPYYSGATMIYGALQNTLKRRRRSTFERYAEEIFSIAALVTERRGAPPTF